MFVSGVGTDPRSVSALSLGCRQWIKIVVNYPCATAILLNSSKRHSVVIAFSDYPCRLTAERNLRWLMRGNRYVDRGNRCHRPFCCGCGVVGRTDDNQCDSVSQTASGLCRALLTRWVGNGRPLFRSQMPLGRVCRMGCWSF